MLMMSIIWLIVAYSVVSVLERSGLNRMYSCSKFSLVGIGDLHTDIFDDVYGGISKFFGYVKVKMKQIIWLG